VYHFFAHYRAAVMQVLLGDEEHDYFLVGDRVDPDSAVKEASLPSERFVVAPCIKLSHSLLWQKGVIRLAFRRDLEAMIFLGNVHFLSTWAAAAIARLSGKRVLFWTHGWIRREKGLKAFIRRRFYKLAHGLLLYGNRAKQIGVEEGFPPTTLYVINNSLDYEAQKVARSQVSHQRIQHIRTLLFGDPQIPVLVCTSRLTKQRGLALLLDAMAQMESSGFKVSLVLVGEGPERERLERQSKEMHLSVHFHGPCYDEQNLAEMIMSANVTVAPGQVGLTAIHSLAYGTPVITHDSPEEQMPEWEAIIPGETGDYFRYGDVHDLARVLVRWVTSPWPNERIRKACVDVVERCYHPQFQLRGINRAVAGLPYEE
jgi:glycosyltransferase involved in cell wall biosynthesis